MAQKRIILNVGTCLLGLLLPILPLAGEVEHRRAGEVVPDVQLRTAEGAAVGLREAVAAQPSLIVFYRGGWCPYCSAHLAELRRVEAEIRELGLQILAVSADRPEKLRESRERLQDVLPEEEPGYTLLSDNRMEAAQAFGVAFRVDDEVVRRYRDDFDIDLEDASGEEHHLLPHPSIFVVDADGKILFAHVDADYKTRLSGAEIIAAAKDALGKGR